MSYIYIYTERVRERDTRSFHTKPHIFVVAFQVGVCSVTVSVCLSVPFLLHCLFCIFRRLWTLCNASTMPLALLRDGSGSLRDSFGTSPHHDFDVLSLSLNALLPVGQHVVLFTFVTPHDSLAFVDFTFSQDCRCYLLQTHLFVSSIPKD